MNQPLTMRERVCAGMLLLLAMVSLLCIVFSCSGCIYKGAKITEGTDLAVGLNVPGTDGAVQLNVLNWLSGFRLGVADNAVLVVDYATSETNDYFGMVTTRTDKRVKARVEPCETTAPKTE